MKFSWFRNLALAAATVNAFPQVSVNKRDTQACNNSPSLCDKQYNKVAYLGAHNSAFLRDDSTNDSLSGNQYYNATKALSAGLRLLQAQVHKESSGLRLCHTSCSLLDAGLLQDWLSSIKSWMDDNPNDVVTILLVNYDGQNSTVSDFASAFSTSGINKYGFTPSGSWPTLKSMISSNKRMVSYVTGIDASQSASYLLNEWDYVFETPFDVSDISGFNCTLDRPSSAGTASKAISNGKLGLLNHFKYSDLTGSIQLPDVDTIDTVNNAGSSTGNIGKHLTDCQSQWKTTPNYVLVDFFSESNPLDAVDSINSVTDATGRTKPTGNSNGSGSAAASGPTRSFGYVALITFFSATLLLV